MRRYITCPETAHLEEIEYYESPVDGTILGINCCTRFTPSDDVPCDMECAHRLNQRLANIGSDDAIDDAFDDAFDV